MSEDNAEMEDRMSSVEYPSVYDGGFNDESAVIELLASGGLFISSKGPDSISLFVNCNDQFYWGTADAEEVGYVELKSLYDAWIADKHWGMSIWCCHHRHLQPQKPMRERMIADGVWTDALAALPEPSPS